MRIVSPMPSASSVPRPTADLIDPVHLVPASVMPRWSGMIDALGQQAVGGDRVRHAGRLDRDLEVVEVEPVHQLDVLDGGLDQRLDRVLALELVQVLGQRAGVDADPDRNPGGLGLVDDHPGLLVAADVARVDPDAVRARVDRLQRERVVEVDVRDDRDRGLRDQARERVDVLLARDGAADDVAAGVGHGADLAQSGVVVGRLGLRHRLDGDGRSAADLDATDVDLSLRRHWAAKGIGAVSDSCTDVPPGRDRPHQRDPERDGARTARSGHHPGRAGDDHVRRVRIVRGPAPERDGRHRRRPTAAAPAADATQTFGQAAPGTYPHLTGDLDASPEILQRLEALAAKKGMKFHINCGHRSIEEQQRLWDNRAQQPAPGRPARQVPPPERPRL